MLRFKRAYPVIFLFVLTLVFFSPVWLQGKTFYAFDTLLLFLPWSPLAPASFWPHNSLITDPVNLLYPASTYFKNCLELVILPLWNGANFCGTPFSGGTLTVLTSPVQLLLHLFFSVSTAHDILLWIYLLGAGLFMYLFLIQIGLRRLPALIGAVSWMFNGYAMVWFEFEMIATLATSLPAALFFFERWKRRRSSLNAACLIAALAISISSGFPHIIIFQTLFICFYILFRLVVSRRSDPLRITQSELKSLLIALCLGACITATFVTTHLNLLNQPQRQGYSFEALYQQTGKLPPKYLLTAIFPDFYGNPASGITLTPRSDTTQSYNNYSELCIYSGILPLFLLLVCLPYLRKRKFTLFFLLTSLISLTMAMGSLLFYPLMKFVPGIGLSTPTRILYIFGFSMCVLAAIGADILLSMGQKNRLACLLLWALIPLTALGFTLFVQTPEGIQWAADYQLWPNWDRVYGLLRTHFSWTESTAMRRPLLILLTTCLLLLLTLFSNRQRYKTVFLFLALLVQSYDLISFGLSYNTASPKYLAYPETNAVRFLKKDTSLYRVVTVGDFMHNAFSPFGIDDIGGYSPFYPKQYGEFLHVSQHGIGAPLPHSFSRWVRFKKLDLPMLSLINTKYLLMPPSGVAARPHFRLVYDKEIRIYENTQAFPRIFFVPEYTYCRSPSETLERLCSFEVSDFKDKVLLEAPPSGYHPGKGDAVLEPSEADIDIISYKPDSIDLRISCSRKGFLVISNGFDPGWKAQVDGVDTEILRANYIMQALPIDQGNHHVEIAFRPAIVVVSMAISSLGWLILILWIGILVVRVSFFRPRRDKSLTMILGTAA